MRIDRTSLADDGTAASLPAVLSGSIDMRCLDKQGALRWPASEGETPLCRAHSNSVLDFDDTHPVERATRKWEAERRPRPEPWRPTPITGHVYFVQAEGGLIKIGYTTCVPDRLRGLRAMSPIPLALLATRTGSPATERFYHELYAAHRAHGEWFNPAPAILAEVERLNS